MFRNNDGFSSYSIMLLALLALTVVLINGIAITVKQDATAKTGILSAEEIASQYCYQVHNIFPEQCKISKIYQCDEYFILRTDCIGVGDIIINNKNEFLNWCGYVSLDGEPPKCGQYWIDVHGQDCTQNNNLCLNI